MRITRIHIKNYRGLNGKSVDFPAQFSVICGDNGKGKTTIMDALSIAMGCFVRGLDAIYQSQKTGSPRSIYSEDVHLLPGFGTEKKEQTPVSIETNGTLFNEKYKWKCSQPNMERERNRITFDSGAKKLIKKAEAAQNIARSTKSDEQILPVLAYFGPERLGIEHRLTKRKEEVGRKKEDEVPYTKQGSRLEGYVDCLSAKSSGKIFKSWFKTLTERANKFQDPIDLLQIETFSKTISEVIPNWKEVGYDFANDDLIGFYSDENNKATFLPLKSLSNGYQSFIGIIADLTYRCVKLNPYLGLNAPKLTNGIVLIDELDLHLHPNWQKKIVADLKKAFPKIQFITSTHSPFIIQSLNAGEVIDLHSFEPLENDPFRDSLEEVSDEVLHVRDEKRSNHFIEMEKTAAQYFDMIASGKSSQNSEEVREIKLKLDELQSNYSEDPAYVALLKSERKSNGL
jgi:predicted ATP-binding protein involved in virulence